MAGPRTIEARLVIAGEDRGASAAIANVVKAVKAMEDAAKVSKPLQDVARNLMQVEQASRAVDVAMKARSGTAAAEAGLKATQGAALAAAKALEEARKARAAFDGVKAAKGSEVALQIETTTKALREAGSAYRKVEGDVKRAMAAVTAQTATMQYADVAAKALGADLGALEAHQQRLRASYDAGTAAITRQIAAEERAAKVGATMGAGGRAQLDRIEQGRRVSEGMSAPGRAAAAAASATARQAAEEVAALRAVRIEATKALASGAGIYVGHKAGEARKEVAHTYAEFDDLIRYQTKVADLTPAERKSRMAQAVHLGGETSFNDIQVLETQLTLAQRGVKKEFVEPFTQEIVNYAQAMNTTLPEAAKTLEGVVFSTNQNVENANGALAVMRKNVDMLVKTAKVGGLGDQDLKEAFKFGGASGTGAGLSPQTMGTIFATLHRVGYAGSEAGVATRAIAARLVSPTNKGRDALDAMGIDPNKFSTMPDAMSGKGLASMSRRTFGKDLSADQMSRIQAAIDDKTYTDEEGKEHSIVEDQGQFAAALAPVLLEGFAKNKKGQYAVKDQKDVAKMIGRFHKMSVESVDSEGLLKTILEKDPTMAQANALFSEKHGGKVVAMSRKMEVFNEIKEAIEHVPEGFAKGIGDYRMEGFSGQMKRLKNTRLNVETAAGRALDDDGEGSGGAITKFVRALADAQQHIAEMDPKLVAAASAAGYFGGKMVEVAGTIGLMGSAIALTKSAFALDAAAVKLGASGGLPGGLDPKEAVKAAPLAALGLFGVTLGTAAGAAFAGYTTAKVLPKIAEKEGPGAIDPATGEHIDTEIPNTTPWLREWWVKNAPTMLGGEPAESGKNIGGQVGKGVADGVQEKSPEIEAQGRTLFQRLKDTFSQGIFVPINFVPGEGMGGGSGIQTASFSGGGGLGGMIRKANLRGGGNIGGEGDGWGGPPVGAGGSGRITGPLAGGPTEGMRGDVRAYVRAAAIARGIDPNVAERVINQESGFNPNRNNLTAREKSYGVMQLNTQGGLGAVALGKGIDPRDPSQWRKHIDFGLDVVKRDGWRQWYGARDVGISRWQGIGSGKSGALAIPEAPEGGFGGGRQSMGSAAERMHAAVDRMEGMGFHGQLSVAVTGSGRDRIRVTGMGVKGRGGMSADLGVSMPGAKESDDDWL